jgi:branched-chain amino acid transport system permease protein
MACWAGRRRIELEMSSGPDLLERRAALAVPQRSWLRDAIAVSLVLLAASLPLWPIANDYTLGVVVRVLLFIGLGQAWNVAAGIGGQLSLGHGIFFGVGAYGTALLFNDAGVTPWIGAWISLAVTLVVALVISGATRRLRGVYFALGTIVISLGSAAGPASA